MRKAFVPFILLLIISNNFAVIGSGNEVKIKEVKLLVPSKVLDCEEVCAKVCVVLDSSVEKYVAVRIYLYDDDFWWDDLVGETEILVSLKKGENEACHTFQVVPSEMDDGGPPDLYVIVKVYELNIEGSEVSYLTYYGKITSVSKRVYIKKGIPVYLMGYVECNGIPLKNRPVIIESIERDSYQFLTEWVWDTSPYGQRGKIRLRTNERGIFGALIHIPIEEMTDRLVIKGRVACSSKWGKIPYREDYSIKFSFGAELHPNPLKWIDVFSKMFKVKGRGSFKPSAWSLLKMIRKVLSDEEVNVEELPAFITISWLGYFGAVHIDCCWEKWDLPEGWEIVKLGKGEAGIPESNSSAVYCNNIDYELCWGKIEKAASELGINVERVTNASLLKNYASILILGGHKAYLDENMRINLAELLLPSDVMEQLETKPGSGTALLVPNLFEFVPKPAVVIAGNTRRETLALLDMDMDGDGLTNVEEGLLGTNPFLEDSDEDGLSDLEEMELGTDPLFIDTDEDGISDGDEVSAGTNPLLWTGSPESNLSWAVIGWAVLDPELECINLTILNLGSFDIYGLEFRPEEQMPQTVIQAFEFVPVNWAAELRDQRFMISSELNPLSPYEYIQILLSAEVLPETLKIRVIGEEGYLGVLEVPVEAAD